MPQPNDRSVATEILDQPVPGRHLRSGLLGARSVLRGLRTALRGHFVGKPVRDAWHMSGAFLIHAGAIVWSQEPAHTGDHPDLDTIHALLLGLTAEPAPASA